MLERKLSPADAFDVTQDNTVSKFGQGPTADVAVSGIDPCNCAWTFCTVSSLIILGSFSANEVTLLTFFYLAALLPDEISVRILHPFPCFCCLRPAVRFWQVGLRVPSPLIGWCHSGPGKTKASEHGQIA